MAPIDLGDGVAVELVDGRLKLTTAGPPPQTIWLTWDACANLLRYLTTLPPP
jgi:hypothetical protein